MLKYFKNFLNGMALGITETVPGVSAGTIAIIIGVYYDLIEAVNHFRKDPKKHLRLLIPLLIGVAVGAFMFISLMRWLLENYSFPTMIFFIGLVVGIIPVVYKKVKEPGKQFKPLEIVLILTPALLLIVISHLRTVTVTDTVEIIANIDIPFMIFIFFAGILAAAALIIPGISGSFVLLLLGIYPLAIYSVSSIGLLFTNFTDVTLLLNICKVLIPLGLGIIIGGLSMARLIGRLLKNYTKIIYSIILGLLIGSVYALFREPITFQSSISALIIIIGVVLFFLGGLLSFTLGKKRL